MLWGLESAPFARKGKRSPATAAFSQPVSARQSSRLTINNPNKSAREGASWCFLASAALQCPWRKKGFSSQWGQAFVNNAPAQGVPFLALLNFGCRLLSGRGQAPGKQSSRVRRICSGNRFGVAAARQANWAGGGCY